MQKEQSPGKLDKQLKHKEVLCSPGKQAKQQQEKQQGSQKGKQPLKQQQQQPNTEVEMEVEELPPPRASSLKRRREEEEDDAKNPRHSERSRADKCAVKSRSQSVPAPERNCHNSQS